MIIYVQNYRKGLIFVLQNIAFLSSFSNFLLLKILKKIRCGSHFLSIVISCNKMALKLIDCPRYLDIQFLFLFI